MKKYRYIKYVASVLSFFCVGLVGFAQTTTPAALEVMKEKSLWMNTSNSAGLLLNDPIKYSSLSISYENVGGNFHRPQTGKRENNLSFNAEGSYLFDKIYAWGSFNYARNVSDDILYNASLIDPYRGMPYMYADTNSSDWKYQFFDMKFKVSTNKFNENIFLGFEGAYSAYGGAKQRDPRPNNNAYQLTINPSIVFVINQQNNLGFNMKYYSFKEESKMENSNTYVDQIYYSFYGLGVSEEHVGNRAEVDYVANNWGGGLYYNFKNNSLDILLSSNYDFRVEDVRKSFTSPRDFGTTKENLWDTKLQLRQEGAQYGHNLVLGYTDRSIDGIEYLTKYNTDINNAGWETLYSDIRSTYKTKEVKLDYDFSIIRGDEYSWKLGAGIKYKKQEDTYLAPRSEKNYENLSLQIRGKRNIILSDKNLRRLLVGADFSLSNNLSGGYSYNGGNPDYVIVTKFQQSDINYLVSDFYSVGGSATYSQQLKSGSQANLFAKVDFRYTKANDFGYNNRHAVLVSLGCNF